VFFDIAAMSLMSLLLPLLLQAAVARLNGPSNDSAMEIVDFTTRNGSAVASLNDTSNDNAAEMLAAQNASRGNDDGKCKDAHCAVEMIVDDLIAGEMQMPSNQNGSVVARLDEFSDESDMEILASQSRSASRSDIIWTCDVIQQGEIRHSANLNEAQNGDGITSTRRPSRCLDVSGSNGQGNVQTADCDGGLYQLWAICMDGTVRNVGSQFCLTRSADGNVVTSGCRIPAPTDAQRWEQLQAGFTIDYLTGLRQDRFRLKNPNARDECLGTDDGYAGLGNVQARANYLCDSFVIWNNWYFNNRGGVIATGLLVNLETGRCLVQSTAAAVNFNVQDAPCGSAGQLSQRHYRTLYGSGELVSAETNRCLEAQTTGAVGNIRTALGCRLYKDLRWHMTGEASDTFLLRNDRNEECAGVTRRRRRRRRQSPNIGNAQTYDCIETPAFRFRWESSPWETPVGRWGEPICSQAGGISHTVTRSVTSTRTITETTTLTVGAEMQKGILFSGASVSVSVSQSLAVSWLTSSTDTTSTTFTCEYYGDGSPVEADNCLWQWQQVMVLPGVDTIEWSPLIVLCTSSISEPRCPAMAKCKDPECSECEEE